MKTAVRSQKTEDGSPHHIRNLFGILVIFLMCITPASAKDAGTRVVVVIANNLSLDDLSAIPNAKKLMDESAVGLMNTGTGRAMTVDARYLALGAGTRINGSNGFSTCYDASEQLNSVSAGDIYTRQTGKSCSPSSIICLGLARIVRANQSSPLDTEVLGLIGNAFHNKKSLRTAAIGNSDTVEERVRLAPLVAMDMYGMVDSGDISPAVTKIDTTSPCGISDDLGIMKSLTRKYIADHALVVVELGDLSRLESVRPNLSDQAYKRYRSRSLQDLDGFIKDIRPVAEQMSATLILLSPCRASDTGAFWSNLAPVVVLKPGGKVGLLISPTTRTAGLISNTDIAPTILHAAGLTVPGHVVGQAADVVPAHEAAGRLSKMEQIAAQSYGLRIPILAVVGALVLISVTMTEIMLRRGKVSARTRRILTTALLVVLSMPAAFLLTDGTKPIGPANYLIRLVITTGLVLGFSYGVARITSRRRMCSPLTILHILTAVLILADVMTGAHLLKWSILTCNQICGIRYYGMGNEYMGVLVASSLLAPILLIRSTQRSAPGFLASWIPAILVFWFVFVIWVIGYSGFGANVGGSITAIAAFGTGLIMISGAKFRFRHALIMTILACVAIAVLAAADALDPSGQGSHLGRTVSLVRTNGLEYFGTLLTHKITMHLGILKLKQSYLPILLSIPFFLMYRQRMKMEKPVTRQADILQSAGIPAMIVGMVVGFLFNDSGVVAAGLILASFMMSMLYLRLMEVAK